MNRSPLKRGDKPLKRKAELERSAWKRSERTEKPPAARSTFKRKPRRPRDTDDPVYLAWVRRWPCCVGGMLCGPARAHHAIEMGGRRIKGMALKAPDAEALPLCEMHHTQFHLGQGFCKGWDKLRRRAFQQDEIDRLRAIWRDQRELGVTQEPDTLAI